MSKQANLTRKLAVDSPDKKPSVFERLGSKSCVVSGKNVCKSWVQNGTCPLNKSCKFAHTHVLISPSKRSKTETMKKSVIVHKKSKDEHKKSVRSHSSEHEWEGWELGDLEDADEKVLERRKQELQRELQLHLKKEKELTRKKDKRIEKKRAPSTSSSSSTSTESSTSTSSSSTSSSEPRKRQNRKRRHPTSTSDSEGSPHRRKKSPKTSKGKVVAVKKASERKDNRVVSEGKNKSVIVAKKSVVQKKSYSPSWEKSRGRSPTKHQTSKKSPHHSPDNKNKSSSPRCDKTGLKNKRFSPKQKGKETSPKRTIKKAKESVVHVKEKPRQSPGKTRTSPSRAHKSSPTRSRRHEESSDKRRVHYDERKHSPRRDRSREKDRKRDVRRGRSNDDDNGGLKKGGKILPLKPPTYSKDNCIKKDTSHHKSSEKSSDIKSKEEDCEKDRNRVDRDRDRGDKEKNKCERDKSKHKKSTDEHDRRSARERESDRNSTRGRDDRCRDREAERLRYTKEREAERQKERDEALERCRERQRERERLEKERKEKEEKKHQRDTSEKGKDFERELPSLLDLKAENPIRSHGDSNSKNSDKHSQRDSRRNLDKGSEKNMGQDRDGRDRDRVTPEKDHDRRELKRSDENDRRLSDKDYDNRRNRDGDVRSSSDVRRSVGDGRRVVDDADSRRQWDDVRRVMNSVHGRRSLDPNINERRQHALVRRPNDDHYRRTREGDLDVRDFSLEERRGRKLLHPEWDPKDQSLDYRDADVRDDWNHPDRHHDWNSRYDHKWRDHEDSRDGWNHYPRRPPLEDYHNDWSQELPRSLYSDERLELLKEEFPDINGKRHNESDSVRSSDTNKGKDTSCQDDFSKAKDGKVEKEGDALSDISDGPDDILNQDDEAAEEMQSTNGAQNNTNKQIYVRSNEFLFEQRRPLFECLGERSLDFEEISDEELEEEARVSKGIIDVLGADWAGLVQETRPRPKHFESQGSARRRWMMDTIISRLGISSKYAGQKFADALVKKYTNDQIKEVKTENTIPMEICESTVKKEKEENEVKEEVNANENTVYKALIAVEKDVKPEVDIKILDSIPALHVAIREAQNMKSSLFQSHNRFKRALSARTDLNLRRELCNFSSKEPLHYTPPLDNKMYETSIQLFHGNFPMAAV